MKKMKVFYLIAVLALLSVSVVTFSGIVQAGAVPEGFEGVPWGASRDRVIKTMSEQGYRQITHPQYSSPDILVFNGSFAGFPCLTMIFYFINNSLYEGHAENCNRSSSPPQADFTFNRIVKMLSEKYGPPNNRLSRPLEGHKPIEIASWEFVDNRSSDKYWIAVHDHVTWFTDTRGDQYVVDVFYGASSLEERLKERLKKNAY
jgi:hypothetical protein